MHSSVLPSLEGGISYPESEVVEAHSSQQLPLRSARAFSVWVKVDVF